MAFCRLLALLVLIQNTGDLLGAEVKSEIVGGRDAAKGAWPWMVHLKVSSADNNKWRCGGTIVGDKWILTAASCWDRHPKPEEARSSVWVGTHELQKASARYMAILHFISHSEYRNYGNRYENDIALIKLKKTIKFSNDVKTVGLPTVDDTFDSSSECWITGWGNTATNVALRDPEILQQLKVNILSDAECKKKFPEVTSDMLCAGGGKGKDACTGDYGGPLVCRTGRGFVQVGIMSYGNPNGCGLEGSPSVYTRVSKYLQFLDYINYGKVASDEV